LTDSRVHMSKKLNIITKGFYPLLILLVFFASFTHASEQNERKKVLVLFSFRPTMPIAKQWENGIRSIFNNDKSSDYIINIEHLDLSHYKKPQYAKLLHDLYRYKYNDQEPDLIIPILNPAVDLVFKYRDIFSPDTPIVFGGVEKQFMDKKTIPPNTTGYFTDISYKETLDLALSLHPETENIFIVGGVGLIVEKWINSLREEYKEYEDRYTLSYLTGLPMSSLLHDLQNLPKHSIIISLPILLDGAGKEFVGNESLKKITQAATAPVYTFWDVALGTGVVGGYMSSFEREGREVASLGVQVLNGQQPIDIPLTRVAKSEHMFDWRQLKRWSIREAKLPAGSIMLFEEFTLWDTYRYQLISSLVLLTLLLLIISRLIIQKRTLHQAKDELLLSKQKYRTVADHTYDWEYWQTPDYVMQYVSPSCKRICDYTAEELIKNPALLDIIILPEDQWIWDKHTCGDQSTPKNKIINFRILRPDGEVRWIEHVCQPVFDHQGNYQGIRASNRDITEREFYKTQIHQLQSDLAHMDRLFNLNTLTSAIAHEINQPLAAMRSYAQAAIRFLNADTPDYENISKALNGIVEDNKRAAAVVNRLRGLVKKGEVQRKFLEVNSVINDVVSLLDSEIILKNISINYNLQPQVSLVFFDLIQLQQVLINLLTNAFDAIESLPVDERTITISSALENENSVIVKISDSGNGIRPELMETVFDPFQTTKPKGIGIGLSICKSILEAHDGKILVDNTKSGGAVFSLILPIAGEPRKNIA
jgi:PAS domain S-box-containing protein